MTPEPRGFTRRDVLKSVAVGALTLPWLSGTGVAAEVPATPAAATAMREHGLRLGLATYSTRMMSLDDTITAIKALRLPNAGLYKAHCNWETVTVDEARAVGEKLRAAGIALTGSGVVNLPNDEAKCRQAFENVKAAGMATMVCKPELVSLLLIERLAKEYDQKVAIHNHGPEDKVYPSPANVWDAVRSLDARIGLCLDVGHAMRSRTDPAAAVRQYATRIYDLHLKDSLAEPGATSDIPTEIGTGRIDIRGLLRALRDINYSGVAALEYEKAGRNPVTGIAESVGFVRGVLATMD